MQQEISAKLPVANRDRQAVSTEHHDQSAGRTVKRKQTCTDDFSSQLASRIKGKPFSQLLVIEFFSGTGGLTAAVRKLGMTQSLGVDAHVTKQVKAPIIRINLAETTGQRLLWKILDNDNVVAIHMGPPCGTSSRAREIKKGKRYNPPPLRSNAHPDGLPTLSGVALDRVTTANRLYLLCSEIMAWATQRGIMASIENPLRSHAWDTSHMQKHLVGLQLHEVVFHHCMYGATRRKRTKLLCNHRCLLPLALQCDNSHDHEGWGIAPTGQWATASEVEYPHQLCQAWAQCLRRCLLEYGAVEPAQELGTDTDIPLVQASRAATGIQPRGKKLI